MSAALLDIGDEFGRLRRLVACVTMCATAEVIDPHALAELGMLIEERAAAFAERLDELARVARRGGQASSDAAGSSRTCARG